MGAYCPAPVINREQMAFVEREIFVPAIDAMRREGIEYRGVLYAGVMLTPGGPKVLEFNCRFGDPECQPLMMRLMGDLLEILWATATGQLDTVEIDFTDDVACCVVMCSGGYPGTYPKGKIIEGLDTIDPSNIHVFHAGTTTDGDGGVITNGGRVLGVTAMGDTLQSARDAANAACDQISFDGCFFRRDIGDRVLTKLKQPV
jgi:phosphoribosylamine--glycine ligase